MTAMLNFFKSSIINKFFLFILFLTIIFPSIVFADGGIIYYDLFNNAYMLNETDQVAYINHDNETQKMIIAVNANSIKSAKSILWLFPLPASPEKIKIDIINKGSSLNRVGKSELIKIQFARYHVDYCTKVL